VSSKAFISFTILVDPRYYLPPALWFHSVGVPNSCVQAAALFVNTKPTLVAGDMRGSAAGRQS